MKNWQEDHLQSLLHLATEEDLLHKLAATARQAGFDYCAYGVQMPIPISRPNILLVNNYPEAWQASYARNEYLEIDPTVKHGQTSSLPLVWTPRLFNVAPAFWEEAREHDIRAGWALAVRDTSGAIGMLTLARGGEPVSESEVFGKQARLCWLAHFAHVAMMRVMLSRQVPESRVLLTVREKEVLRWTAEGKTAYEIGQILAVSERTVNFHINNVVAKFSASNKTQAAVKAAALGLLF